MTLPWLDPKEPDLAREDRRKVTVRLLDVSTGIDYALTVVRAPGSTRPEPAIGTAVAVSSPLTRREHEVADLVADGLSNKQIATKLIISQRTVDAHVAHILSKLDFTSRAQIAAWITAHST
ncbi:helix-turn-helix transcriptional regulator [Streptomyces sp. NPDC051776]|uniref:helix-turn-helix transcriptional regulator n=1 Tax=Streptomyces sp. NPDC051776 TaxID=3155414 RepID=UPI003422A4A5